MRHESPVWVLENNNIKLTVERETGWLRALIYKDKKINLLGGQIGGVKIYDGLKDEWYSDLQTPFRISSGKCDSKKLEFIKHFQSADFNLKVMLSVAEFAKNVAEVSKTSVEDYIRWEVVLQKNQGTSRTIEVHFLLPLLIGFQFWAPAANTPFIIDGAIPFEYVYLQPGWEREILVPIVCMYSKELDVGITFSEELDKRSPGSRYLFEPQSDKDAYFEVAHPDMGLREEKPLSTSILMKLHEGDWRPGLGWLYNKYREYFNPGLSKINEQVGTFLCGNIRLEDSWETYITKQRPDNEIEDRMKRLKEIGFQFMEIHDHFPFYGLYAPEAEEWENVAKLENPDSEIGFVVTYQAVGDFINYLHQHGIYGNIYFQFSQCYERYAEGRFPESIAEDENGNRIPAGWPYLYVMNPDVNLPWGKYCVEQMEKLLKAYPKVDGFFLDCFRHQELDFAHDDGLTVVDNKPCYNINFAYDRITEIITEKLHSKGLVNFANKPRTIQQTKGIDCVLLEGSGKVALTKQFFLCVARPMIYMWMDGRPISGRAEEEYLKQCLLYGAFPQVSCYHNVATEEEWIEIVKVYQSYLPLIERLRGRRLAFDPAPLELPPLTSGEIFVNPDGDYVISVVSEHPSIKDGSNAQRELDIKITPKEPIDEAFLMLPGDKEPKRTQFSREGKSIRVFIPECKCAALIELRKGQQYTSTT